MSRKVSIMENWEKNRLKYYPFTKNSLKKSLLYLFFFFITCVIIKYKFILQGNYKIISEILLWGISFFVGRILILKIRSWIDIYQNIKYLHHTSIIYLINFKLFKILLLKDKGFKILINNDPYFLDVKANNEIIIKYSFTKKIIDFYIINKDEKIFPTGENIDYSNQKINEEALQEKGYLILPNVYSNLEIKSIIETLNNNEPNIEPAIKTSRLILFKSYFKKNKEIKSLLLNKNLSTIIKQLFDSEYFVVNSMYFDKPKNSPWGVSYHQDRQIIVKEKKEVAGFNEWFERFNLITVRAPNEIIKEIFTIRVHIDITTDKNGSLQVIEESHSKGIFDPVYIDKTKEVNCDVDQGGIMIMSPLLMHQSLGSHTSELKRRVIHFDITNIDLPGGLAWGEKEFLFNSQK
jgi:hypothetical protein